jgi:tetratricopeptide (TPR) repeat protein
MAQGRFTDADKDLGIRGRENAPRVVLHASLATARGEYDTAVQRLDGLEDLGAASLRGWIAIQRCDYENAITHFRKGIRVGGANPGLLTNLALAHAFVGARPKALNESRQAAHLAPNDRRVGFNLVSLLSAGGDSAEVKAELRRLRQAHPQDIEVVFCDASVKMSFGAPEDALRVLRRARTGLWAYASPTQQAELTANLSYVEWHLGRISASQAARTLLDQLRATDYGSVRMAAMVPVLLGRFSDLARFRATYERLQAGRPEYWLPRFKLHMALLERRFEDATEEAVKWSHAAVLDPVPAASASYLLAEVRGDYHQAAAIGMKALRRMPAAVQVRNNVAYALAMAGRPAEAAEYLEDGVDAPEHVTTNALIDLMRGKTDAALNGYERAYRQADGDPVLQFRIALARNIGLKRINHPRYAEFELKDAVSRLPREWTDQPKLALALCLARRERVELPERVSRTS